MRATDLFSTDGVAAIEPYGDAAPAVAGFLLVDLSFAVLYANHAAVEILAYPRTTLPQAGDRAAFLQQSIRSILNTDTFATDLVSTRFLSGRRQCLCRPFFLESSARSPIVALLLERRPSEFVELSELSRRFHLSRRESETVQHLVRGLTTKEVAQQMNVSPNTIKQFVRLTMSKMGVTTRSGIVGKFIVEGPNQLRQPPGPRRERL